MPRNQFQRMVFAFLTVLVTVHAYVFYSLYFLYSAPCEKGIQILVCQESGIAQGRSIRGIEDAGNTMQVYMALI